MLYERWRQISSERRNDIALRDGASGRRWTFGQLFCAGQSHPAREEEVAFPQGHSPQFILDLLAAWRDGKTVCPLEPGQAPPQFSNPPRKCVHLKCTSATTGAARLAAFTGGQLAADAENIVRTMGLRADWPNMGVISLAHSYGFSNLVLPLLLHGIPLILAPAPLPEMVRRATENERAVTLPSVPAMWRAWGESKAIPANVRLAISAGAPLPLRLEAEIFESLGLKIHNFYGASECGGIAFDAEARPRGDGSCVGAALSNVNLSVNEDGCLTVRSGAVAETYWPEEADSPGGGVFHTSDLAELKEGLVYLRGRRDDQINVAGRKVSPETIERACLANPGVRECLVFGAPSREEERSEIIVAVVAGEASEGELRQYLLQTLPAWQVPRQWRFVKTLPASARGKLSRQEWRRRFAAAD